MKVTLFLFCSLLTQMASATVITFSYSDIFVDAGTSVNSSINIDNINNYTVIGGQFTSRLVDDVDGYNFERTDNTRNTRYVNTFNQKGSLQLDNTLIATFERNVFNFYREYQDLTSFSSAGTTSNLEFAWLSPTAFYFGTNVYDFSNQYAYSGYTCSIGYCFNYDKVIEDYFTNNYRSNINQVSEQLFAFSLDAIDIAAINDGGSFDFSLTSQCAVCDLNVSDQYRPL